MVNIQLCLELFRLEGLPGPALLQSRPFSVVHQEEESVFLQENTFICLSVFVSDDKEVFVPGS